MLRINVSTRVAQSVAALPAFGGRGGEDDAAAPSLGSLYIVWSQRRRRARGAPVREPALASPQEERCERRDLASALWPSSSVASCCHPHNSRGLDGPTAEEIDTSAGRAEAWSRSYFFASRDLSLGVRCLPQLD